MVNRRNFIRLLSLGGVGAGFATCGRRVKAKEIRSTFAPYWYIDDSTDSVLEVKNHLEKRLTLLPTLSLGDGSLKLSEFTVPALATRRISLRSALVRRAARDQGVGRWGDGSRPGSMFGSAILSPMSPEDAGPSDFSAWIVAQNMSARLVLVASPFMSPSLAGKPVLEGIWWMPRQGSRVFYMLQNPTSFALEVRSEIFSNGSLSAAKTSRIAPLGSALVDINESLGTAMKPDFGGVRFSYRNTTGEPVLVHALGRGVIVDEQVGLVSPLMLQDSLGNIPTDAQAELYSPAVAFGRIEPLIKAKEISFHPHLFLRNVSARSVTAQVTVYAQAGGGTPYEWRLQKITLTPEETLHIDLEERRRLEHPNLSDGTAALRISHEGTATDLIGELINVDESRNLVFYDRMKNASLTQAETQAAISFDLRGANRTFILLRNASNEPRDVEVVIHYDDGGGAYRTELKQIPPHEGRTIDIASIRDGQIPDVVGTRLPPSLESGSVMIQAEAGVLGTSDPTVLTDGPPGVEAIPTGVYSCTSQSTPPTGGGGAGPGGGGGGGTPPKHTYPRSPLRGPCVEIAGCTLLPDHKARDIASVPTGDFGEEVRLMEDAQLVDIGNGTPGGRFSAVIVKKDGVLTIYGHVQPLPGLERRLGETLRQGEQLGVTDRSGVFRDLPAKSHVHVSRMKALGGSQDDYEQVLDRESRDGLCNFDIPCMAPAQLVETLGAWPYQ